MTIEEFVERTFRDTLTIMVFVIKVTALHCLRRLNAYERSEKEAMLLDIQGCEYSLIDPEITNDIVEETPPQAPPAAITSPIIVPEPQVPHPISALLSLYTYHDPRCGLLCPPSIEIHSFFCSSPKPSSSWARK